MTVLTTRFRDQPKIEQMCGFTVWRIPSLRRQVDRSSVLEMVAFLISAIFHATSVARQVDPQATIAFFGLPCGPIGYVLKKRLGIPYIVSLRGGDVPGYMPDSLSLFHRLTAPISRITWRSAGAVVANSKGLANLASQFTPDRGIDIIPNGVDTQLFCPPSYRKQSDRVTILTVGRLQHQKANDILLQAFAGLVESERHACRLIIVGDGPEKARLVGMAGNLGVAKLVDFRGWVDRKLLPDLYRTADIFAFPSREEGMPNAVLEAMASGLPVIATPISGIEELVTPEVTGLLVPLEDHRSLAIAISKLVQNSSLRQAMGASGRVKVTAQFSWNASAEAYLAMVDRITA